MDELLVPRRGFKLVANMIVTAGADRVLGIDFHQHQLQGFFDIPVDHLYAAPVFVSHYRKKQLREVVVVAPDVGSAKIAEVAVTDTIAIPDDRRQLKQLRVLSVGELLAKAIRYTHFDQSVSSLFETA